MLWPATPQGGLEARTRADTIRSPTGQGWRLTSARVEAPRSLGQLAAHMEPQLHHLLEVAGFRPGMTQVDHCAAVCARAPTGQAGAVRGQLAAHMRPPQQQHLLDVAGFRPGMRQVGHCAALCARAPSRVAGAPGPRWFLCACCTTSCLFCSSCATTHPLDPTRFPRGLSLRRILPTLLLGRTGHGRSTWSNRRSCCCWRGILGCAGRRSWLLTLFVVGWTTVQLEAKMA